MYLISKNDSISEFFNCTWFSNYDVLKFLVYQGLYVVLLVVLYVVFLGLGMATMH